MAEMMFERSVHGLLPADEASAERMRAWSPGEVIRVKASRPRNGRNHRRFFKLLQVVRDNIDSPITVNQLLTLCKLNCGYASPIIGPGGEQLGWDLDSIDFASMDESDFRVFYRDSSRYLCATFLNVEPEQLAEYVGLL